MKLQLKWLHEDENTPCNDAVTTDSSPVKYRPDLPIKSTLICIVSTRSEAQKVLSNILGIPLFEDDSTCLLDNEKLNDTIVVIFTRKLMIESPHLKNVILPDSIFYLSLSQNSPNITQCERFKRASRFVKTLGPQDTLVVPICENDHWYVIVVNSSYAIVMDSLSIHALTRNKQILISLICKFLNWRNPDVVYAIKRYCLKVPQQINSTDCGVYLILNLIHFFKSENYSMFIEDGEKFCLSDHTNWFT